MKTLKKILFVILAVIALALVVAIFVDGKYSVVKEVEIDSPKSEVFEYLKHLKNQDNFSVWAKMDPNMKKTYKGTDGEVGFISQWDSDNENVGKGEQEIMSIKEGERIDFEIRFKEPFESEGNAYMTTESIGTTKTKVQWAFEGEMPYPMNLMMLFMDMEEQLGPDLQKGLDELKVVLEGATGDIAN